MAATEPMLMMRPREVIRRGMKAWWGVSVDETGEGTRTWVMAITPKRLVSKVARASSRLTSSPGRV